MKIIFHVVCDFLVITFLIFPAHSRAQDVNRSGILNATYMIDKRPVHLFDGQAEIPVAPGSATKITTRVVSEPVFGDLNNDGKEDAALFLVQDPGGSGTFYYIAVAIAKDGIYHGTNAVLLGDRVIPRTIHIRNNVIIVNYVDRLPDEPMSTPPSLVKSMSLRLNESLLLSTEAP